LTNQLQHPAPPISQAELDEMRALIPPGFQSRWLAGRSIMTHELAVHYVEDVPRLLAEIERLRRRSFGTLGEFLRAVLIAGQGGPVDPRLEVANVPPAMEGAIDKLRWIRAEVDSLLRWVIRGEWSQDSWRNLQKHVTQFGQYFKPACVHAYGQRLASRRAGHAQDQKRF